MSEFVRESGSMIADRLAKECIEEVTNFESQQSLLERDTDYREVKAFYLRDCPEKILVPGDLIDEYRKRIFQRSYSSTNTEPTDPEVEAETTNWADETLKENPARQRFPWLHYSHGAKAFVVDRVSLSIAFETDYHQDYPAIPREEQ